MKRRLLYLRGDIDDASAHQAIEQLLAFEREEPDRDIELYLDSQGGTAEAALSLYNCMQLVRCDIRTVGLRSVAGVAPLLLCAGTPGKRSLQAHSLVTIEPKELLREPYERQTGQVFDEPTELNAEQAIARGLADGIS